MQTPASTSQKIAVEDRVISLSEIAHKVVRSAQAALRHKLLFAIVCGAFIVAGGWAYIKQPIQFESHAEVAVYSAMDFDQIEESLQTVWRRDHVLTSAAQNLLSNHSSSRNEKAVGSKVSELRSQLSVNVVDGRRSGKPVAIVLTFRGLNAENAQQALDEIVTAGLREFEQLDLAENRHPIFHDSKRSQTLGTLRSLIDSRDKLKERLSVSMLQTSSHQKSIDPDPIVPGIPETLRGSIPLPQADNAGKAEGMAGVMYRELLNWVAQPVGAPERTLAQSESTKQLHTLNAQLMLQSLQEEIRYLRSRVALAELASQPTTAASSLRTPLSRFLPRFAFIGLLAGIASVLLVDKVQARFHSPADVETLLRLQRLATLPSARSDELLRITANTQTSESFVCLSKVLETSPIPLECVTVTSGGEEEGAAYIALNLAEAAASCGKRTLLVDADLRAAELTGELGLNAASGLSDLLADHCELATSLRPAATVAGFDILPSGKKTDQSLQLLANRTFDNLIDDLRQQYDLIVINAPSTQKSADAAVVGRASDGLLLAVHGRRSKTAVSLQACRQFASFGVHVAGAVVIRDDSWKSSNTNLQYSGLATVGGGADTGNAQLNSTNPVDETMSQGAFEFDNPKLRNVA